MKIKGTQTTTQQVEVDISQAQQMAIAMQQDKLELFQFIKKMVLRGYSRFLAERLCPSVIESVKNHFFVGKNGWLYAANHDYDYHNNKHDDWAIMQIPQLHLDNYKMVEEQLEEVEHLILNFTNRKSNDANQ